MISVKSSLQNVTCGRCDAKFYSRNDVIGSPWNNVGRYSIPTGRLLAKADARGDAANVRTLRPGQKIIADDSVQVGRRLQFPRYTVQRSGT